MTKGGTTTMIGGLVAAFFASICCIGPLVFAALGVAVGATGFLAGTASFLKALLPYRPVFIGLTVLLLIVSFYLAYRKRKLFCAPGAMCATDAKSGAKQTLLWAIAVVAIVLVLAPYWLGL